MRSALGACVLGSLSTGCAQAGATEQGQQVHQLFVTIALIAAPVFVIVELLLLYFVFRYRKRDEEAAPQQLGSNRALIIFFLIPTIIVGVVYAFGESTLASVQTEDPHPQVEIRVEGFQWEWTFYYLNEGFFTTGKTVVKPAVMYLPVDSPVHFQLVSRDVIHSFFVPAFLFKRDVVPGRTNEFTVTPTTIGTYQAQCAEFCGLHHAQMTFSVHVVTYAEYQAWVKGQLKAAQNVSCPVGSNNVTVTAKDTAWNTNCIAVNAGAPISLTISNQDAGIDHNFAVYDDAKLGQRLVLTGKFSGVATNTYQVGSLPAGKYYFQCDVHGPSMSGTFIVAGTKKP
ncbi:MAG: cytochrome c oxidase subunit II [Actinomycetota bacterium]